MKTNELIFKSFLLDAKKTVKRYLAMQAYCGENNVRGFETLLQLVYQTLVHSCGNIAS